MLPPHRNQSVELQCKSTDWFLYDRHMAFNVLRKQAICKQKTHLKRSEKSKENISDTF